MKSPFPVLMLAAIRHPLDYPLIAELVFGIVILTAGGLAVLWHHGTQAAARFNTWWYCRRGAREVIRELGALEHADESTGARPQMPGYVSQPKRRIPLRRLPLRPEFRNPIKTRKVR